MPLKMWIQNVLALQDLDIKIRNLNVKLSAVPAEKKHLDDEIKAAEANVNAAKNALRAIENEIKDTAAQNASVSENMRKLLTQTVMVKKNNEYQALLADIESKKAAISDLETKELELYDRQSAAQKVLAAAEHDCALDVKSIKAEIADLEGLEKDIKADIASAVSLRKAHTERIDATTLEAYSRLLASKKGEPLARISDGGTCSNCRLKLTPQTINDAKRGGVVFCDNCSHMIYMPVQD